MNIYTTPGSKVIFAHPTWGYDHDIYQASKYLVHNAIYTVDRCEPHACDTDVYLTQFPNIPFNSVQFDNLPE